MKPVDDIQPTQAQTGRAGPFHSPQPPRRVWDSLSWWPTVAGIGLAGFIALDTLSGRELAPILAASGLVYLGAAGLRKPSAAWPLFLGTFVVITIDRIGRAPFDATWIFLGLAALFVGYGVLHGAARPIDGLPLQAIGMVGFGAVAGTGLIVSGDAGAYLIAAGLLAHAAWDVYHHWVNKVVVRSMAEFCCVLDILLAAALVVVALQD
jgi:hypothetical protein